MKLEPFHACGAILLVAAGAAFAQATGAKSPGKWVKGSFAQVNVFCVQAYQCIPGKNILHGSDTVVKTTPNEGVQGVCNAGGGPADSCNVCASNPPAKPCEYWLENKQ